jgi:hypothetical protein
LARRSSYFIPLLAAFIVGCGTTGKAGDENKAPEYAASPRKSLESWITAVRKGDIDMMCRLSAHDHARRRW